MATYLFAWNPSLWNWPELAKDIGQLKRRGHYDTEWNSGRVRNIEVGSRAFLIRVGVPPKGLFGAGYTLTAPVPTLHWRPEKAANGATQQRLTLRLESLHPLPLITYDDLAVPPYSRFRWGVRSSGVRIPSTLAEKIEELWEVRVAAAPKASARRSGRR
jgi:5-methylcytosine-specific restriction protein A